MNPSDRSELFRALADVADRHPHWRFGQLIGNLAGWAEVSAWDVEDARLIEEARSHLGTAEGHDPACDGGASGAEADIRRGRVQEAEPGRSGLDATPIG